MFAPSPPRYITVSKVRHSVRPLYHNVHLSVPLSLMNTHTHMRRMGWLAYGLLVFRFSME